MSHETLFSNWKVHISKWNTSHLSASLWLKYSNQSKVSSPRSKYTYCHITVGIDDNIQLAVITILIRFVDYKVTFKPVFPRDTEYGNLRYLKTRHISQRTNFILILLLLFQLRHPLHYKISHICIIALYIITQSIWYITPGVIIS